MKSSIRKKESASIKFKKRIRSAGLILFSVFLSLPFVITSCSDSDNGDEAAMGALAYILSQENADTCEPGGISFETTGSGFTCNESGVASTEGTVSLFSDDNVSQKFLSLEVNFLLGDGGSLELMAGVSHDTDGNFEDGHGMKFENDAAYFQGSDGSSVVVSDPLAAFTPGQSEHTICFEVHMDENPAHIVINYANGGCSGLDGIANADTDSEDSGFIANTASIPASNYSNFGVRLNKGSILSITRSTQAHFEE